jgi:gluconate 2-dehydrogenase gamma chain
MDPRRRIFFRKLPFVPAALAGLGACGDEKVPATAPAERSPAQPYAPTFFSTTEWEFLVAACSRLIPADEHGPGAIECGVPEFIDRHMNTPYAAGEIWYLQGPFLEASKHFGYQGRLAPRDILRVGIRAMDTACASAHDGKRFAQLNSTQQDEILQEAEAGKLALGDIGAKVFFDQLLQETRFGYFSDPKYGGNRNMGAWKMIGYPGMRADYTDWVGVRDQPYPLPPVDLSGQRG